MKKTLLGIGALALVLGIAVAAVAAADGFSCQNICPLAKKANECRSYGSEAPSMKSARGAEVQKNVSRI